MVTRTFLGPFHLRENQEHMSVLFNHARRYELFNDNPMNLLPASPKCQTSPNTVHPSR